MADRIYRMLTWLYPARHRRTYGGPMLQHARDMRRAAQKLGRQHVVALWMRLLVDAIANAGIEHGEAIMTAKRSFKPTSWQSVLLALLPGLWVALSRGHAGLLAPLILVLGGGYLLLITLGLPITWWRKRRFPVWGLMFGGMVIWYLIQVAGSGLSAQLRFTGAFSQRRGILILNLALAFLLFAALLRGRRVPRAGRIIIGFMALVSILLAAPIFYPTILGKGTQLTELERLLVAIPPGLAGALMLVAVGLLAAKQHGVLALLVVVGGYGYLLMDTDYLFGHPSRDWSGLSWYLAAMSLLYSVITPLALLRTRTRLGRTLAAFVPTLIFLAARMIVPSLAVESSLKIELSDVLLSTNILLSLVLGWMLYDQPNKALDFDGTTMLLGVQGNLVSGHEPG